MAKKYSKLHKVFKRQWLKALRSGKYEQGDSMLYNKGKDTYCCLGVAGDVCKIPLKNMNEEGTFYEEKYKNKIPLILFGSSEDNIVVSKLTDMNDCGKSFKRIATWIEKYL